MMSNRDLVDARQIAEVLGISIHTVRDYKKRGLIKIAAKQGNKDLYDKLDAARRQSIIDQKRREGYTLSQIASLVEEELKMMT